MPLPNLPPTSLIRAWCSPAAWRSAPGVRSMIRDFTVAGSEQVTINLPTMAAACFAVLVGCDRRESSPGASRGRLRSNARLADGMAQELGRRSVRPRIRPRRCAMRSLSWIRDLTRPESG